MPLEKVLDRLCEHRRLRSGKASVQTDQSSIFSLLLCQKGRWQNTLVNYKNCFIQTITYWEFKNKRANSVYTDKVAHYEMPCLDPPCLQVHLFPCLVEILSMIGKFVHKVSNSHSIVLWHLCKYLKRTSFVQYWALPCFETML